jgi:hypothetical protein
MGSRLFALLVFVLVCGCMGGETTTPTTSTTNPENNFFTSSTIPTTTISTTSTTTTLSGTDGTPCQTYKDCKKDLLCKDSLCTAPPTYTKYFVKIELQKMNATMKIGPTNQPIASSEFKTSDGIYVEFTLKPGITGAVYSDLNDAVTGEKLSITAPMTIAPTPTSRLGWAVSTPKKEGKYELNIYYNDNLTHTIPFNVID